MKKWCLLLLCFFAVNAYAQQRNELNIYFDSDKDYIPDTSALRLMQMANSAVFDTVLIYGHCDSIGSDAYNKILSEKRVKSVRRMLQMNGLKPEIIKSTVGYGEQKPIASNTDTITRRLNRRVEVLFAKGAQKIVEAKPVVVQKPAEVKKPKQIIIEEDPSKKAQVKYISKQEEAQLAKTSFEIGEVLEFKQLQFQPAFHYLLPGRETIVDEIAEMLHEHPKVNIEIQGHVCCTTYDDEDGMDQEYMTNNLSYTRAYYIMSLLRDHGIAAKRMRAVGKKGSQKIDKLEITEEAKALNRRVEIHVVK
jgi:outer membrane protein OmpA-like peptidoglycan-associated protein